MSGEEALGAISRMQPLSMKTIVSATVRAKRISWVTITMVSPSFASSWMTLSTSPTISGSRALVGSSNRMTFGLMASARLIATHYF
jgi:hypothetical protein